MDHRLQIKPINLLVLLVYIVMCSWALAHPGFEKGVISELKVESINPDWGMQKQGYVNQNGGMQKRGHFNPNGARHKRSCARTWGNCKYRRCCHRFDICKCKYIDYFKCRCLNTR